MKARSRFAGTRSGRPCRKRWVIGRIRFTGRALIVLALVVAAPWTAVLAVTSRPSSGALILADLRFPSGSRVETLADRMWLNGAPMQALVFDAPVDVPELIRHLSRQQPALDDLYVLPGQVILSGRVGEAFWMAQLASPAAGRSVGRLSSIQPSAAPTMDLPVWLPTHARSRLNFTVLEAGLKVSEDIWQHPLPPARLTPLLRQGLLRDGWHSAESDQAAGAWQSWRRQDERLQWVVVALDAGSGLWVRRWTP